jgi:hypothetical protein
MKGLPILLSRQKSSFIPIEDSSGSLTDYLRGTTRAVDALFDQRGLRDQGGGTYCYLARPIRVVWWDVVPELSFHIEQSAWQQDAAALDLRLVLDSCQLSGDERWAVVADNLTFDCHACFTTCLGGVQCSATATATVNRSGWLRLMPGVVIRELATPAVDFVLERLLMRCEKSLCKDMERWLMQNSLVVSG